MKLFQANFHWASCSSAIFYAAIVHATIKYTVASSGKNMVLAPGIVTLGAIAFYGVLLYCYSIDCHCPLCRTAVLLPASNSIGSKVLRCHYS